MKKLSPQQKKLRRTLRLLEDLANFFEEAGFANLAEPLDLAAENIEDVAERLELLGFAPGVS